MQTQNLFKRVGEGDIFQGTWFDAHFIVHNTGCGSYKEDDLNNSFFQREFANNYRHLIGGKLAVAVAYTNVNLPTNNPCMLSKRGSL